MTDLFIRNPYHPIKYQSTFLDIADFPESELVSSNLYTFFLRVDADHELGTLMLDSLLEGSGIEADFIKGSFEVFQEVGVNSGRIDILIKGIDSILIIENKIYHILNNPLTNYLEDIKRSNPGFKVKLVVLGLVISNSVIDSGNIYVATHKRVLDIAVKKLQALEPISRYRFLLEDLHVHMNQTFYQTADTETLKFLLENGKELRRLQDAEEASLKKLQDWSVQGLGSGFSKYRMHYNKQMSIRTPKEAFWLYLDFANAFSDQVILCKLVISSWKYAGILNAIPEWNDDIVKYSNDFNMELELGEANTSEPIAMRKIKIDPQRPEDIIGELEKELKDIWTPFLNLISIQFPELP